MLGDIKTNTSRYVDILEQLIHDMLPPRNIPIAANEAIKKKFENILNNHRLDNIEVTNEEGARSER